MRRSDAALYQVLLRRLSRVGRPRLSPCDSAHSAGPLAISLPHSLWFHAQLTKMQICAGTLSGALPFSYAYPRCVSNLPRVCGRLGDLPECARSVGLCPKNGCHALHCGHVVSIPSATFGYLSLACSRHLRAAKAFAIPPWRHGSERVTTCVEDFSNQPSGSQRQQLCSLASSVRSSFGTSSKCAETRGIMSSLSKLPKMSSQSARFSLLTRASVRS